MKENAVSKSRDRLRIARKSFQRLEESTNHTDFSDEWFTFISSTKSIWSDLQQGSKISPQSRQWYGGKQRERKSNSILQYMFIARNNDQHGLAYPLEYKPETIRLGVDVGDVSMTMHSLEVDSGMNQVKLKGKDKLGNDFETIRPTKNKRIEPAKTILKIVRDRAGQNVQPPTMSPMEAAAYTIEYLSNLVDEAQQLCTP